MKTQDDSTATVDAPHEINVKMTAMSRNDVALHEIAGKRTIVHGIAQPIATTLMTAAIAIEYL